MFRGDDAGVAESFAAADPYVRDGLVVSWHILTTRDTSPTRGPKMNSFLSIIRANQDIMGTLVLGARRDREVARVAGLDVLDGRAGELKRGGDPLGAREKARAGHVAVLGRGGEEQETTRLPSVERESGGRGEERLAGGWRARLPMSGHAEVVTLAFMRSNSSSSMTPSALSEASFDSWSTSLDGAAASRT